MIESRDLLCWIGTSLLFASVPISLWYFNIILFSTLKIILCCIIFLFVIVPIIFKNFKSLQTSMIFLNYVKWPRNSDLLLPERLGLQGTRNFYIRTDDNVKLGVWHILPNSMMNNFNEKDESFFVKSLNNGEPVILYMHGNSGSRALSSRVELYKVLRTINCHIVSFDYRSYGDSSVSSLSEDGVVSDGIYMIKWVLKRASSVPVFVWGHSLGTGISAHALANISEENSRIKGLILEAPFNKLEDEVREHPLARVFSFLPWFDYFFIIPISSHLKFNTEHHLAQINTPILIIHAEDDAVIPFHLGKRLYNYVANSRGSSGVSVRFVKFDRKYKYGHKYICRSPQLPQIIQDFMAQNNNDNTL